MEANGWVEGREAVRPAAVLIQRRGWREDGEKRGEEEATAAATASAEAQVGTAEDLGSERSRSGSFSSSSTPSEISSLPPEIVSYFTDPNATGPPPDMQLLHPFVESALPVAYGVLAIQVFHEVGHFLAVFPKNVKLGIPYFIPNFTLGTFGAITQFKSILPDRKTMFDISMAGPVAGVALLFSMFFVGLLLSSNPVGASDLVEVPSQLFQGSLLLGLINRAALGYGYLIHDALNLFMCNLSWSFVFFSFLILLCVHLLLERIYAISVHMEGFSTSLIPLSKLVLRILVFGFKTSIQEKNQSDTNIYMFHE